MTSYEKFFGEYLKKADIKGDTPVTIKQVKSETVGGGEDASVKPVCYLEEFDRPLVLNQGNSAAIANVAGSKEIEDWVGKKVTLFIDPAVMYKGKRVGGIRIRVPSGGVQV